MSDMMKEFQETIKKNLPMEVGEALKKRLSDLERTEGRYESLKVDHKDKCDALQGLHTQVAELQAELEQHETLSAREDSVLERERKAHIFSLQHELNAQKRMAEHATAVAMGLVRNTEFRKNLSKGFDSDWAYNDQNEYKETKTDNGTSTAIETAE